MKGENGSGTGVVLRVLGPLELAFDGESVSLPRSKKCRALLAYVAVTGREHRRDRLCDLFWDVADDPRGALRWTLSRLRGAVPGAGLPIDADRETVVFRTADAFVDAHELGRLRGARLSELTTDQLEAAAGLSRGEFLEGLELPDFLEFTAWCVAQREEFRRLHCAVLHELVGRWPDEPERALGWARKLVQVDAFAAQAHEALLRLLLAAGYAEEAEVRYEHAAREFRQVSAPEYDALRTAWRSLRSQVESVNASPVAAPARRATEPAPSIDAAPGPFVGRQRQLEQLRQAIASARGGQRTQAVVVTAEPGGGKTRLLDRFASELRGEEVVVLAARSFDLERGRPFGPWLDALGVGSDALEGPAQAGRAQLFEKFLSLLEERARGAAVLLMLDDVQWLDPDSAEVLQHVVQTYDAGPIVALLGARGGELDDNQPVLRVLRNLRKDRVLRELKLEPLSPDEVAQLVGIQPGVDVDAIAEACAGNPLYALELVRGAAEGLEGPPPTLVELMRERVSRLSPGALDLLRWGAVLGYAFDAMRLEALCELSQLDFVDALEELERHALLRIDVTRSQDRYAFSHDVVREVVYGELSHPRRRLMHRKTAALLRQAGTDPATAYEVARHASLAGDDQLGVSACIEAGRYALRTCANADAEALARRGLQHAADLEEAARVEATLELLHVLYSARAPDRTEATERVRGLAERALDLGLTHAARIGFQMLSYMRWESSSMADAHANILQAERVSRTADPDERSQALASAARCLVLLERNLPQAEAFAMEAAGLARRNGRTSAAVTFAVAMIAAHRGDPDVADAAFRETQDLARAGGERLAEFAAIEHRMMLELDGPVGPDELTLGAKLEELGQRVRPGSEVAVARALHALARWRADVCEEGELEAAVDGLRAADSKYELSFVLTRWAASLLERDAVEEAWRVALDALDVANAAGRASEQVFASTILAGVELQRGETEPAQKRLAALESVTEADLSAPARTRLLGLRSALDG